MDQLLLLKNPTATRTFSVQQLDRYASIAADNYLKNVRLLQSLSKQYGFRYSIIWLPVVFAREATSRLNPDERKALEGLVE